MKFAVKFDVDTNNISRIAAGIEYVLKSNLNNGHTCLPHTKLIDVSARFLDVQLEKVEEALEIMLDSLRLFGRELDGTLFIFLPEYAQAEEYISNKIKVMLSCNQPLYSITEQELNIVEQKLNIEFDAMQISAVNYAMENNLFVLTGGPGTGKTTIINGIIQMYKAVYKLIIRLEKI